MAYLTCHGSLILNKTKYAIPPLHIGPEVLSSAFDEAKLFAKNSSWNLNPDDSGTFLPASSSRTNLKLHNVHVQLLSWLRRSQQL